MGGRLLEGPTMASRTSDWRDELGRWLKPFLDRLGHKARRQMCPLYVSGLIGPGDRKSVQPMAERVATGDYDQLHHFIAAGAWKPTLAPVPSVSYRPRCRSVRSQSLPHQSKASRVWRSMSHSNYNCMSRTAWRSLPGSENALYWLVELFGIGLLRIPH